MQYVKSNAILFTLIVPIITKEVPSCDHLTFFILAFFTAWLFWYRSSGELHGQVSKSATSTVTLFKQWFCNPLTTIHMMCTILNTSAHGHMTSFNFILVTNNF